LNTETHMRTYCCTTTGPHTSQHSHLKSRKGYHCTTSYPPWKCLHALSPSCPHVGDYIYRRFGSGLLVSLTNPRLFDLRSRSPHLSIEAISFKSLNASSPCAADLRHSHGSHVPHPPLLESSPVCHHPNCTYCCSCCCPGPLPQCMPSGHADLSFLRVF
jgi:hypothetical protein